MGFLRDKAARRKTYDEYGFLIERLGYRVFALHGFSGEEHGTVIKDRLDQTAFKGNHRMAPTDMWMKTILRKHG